MKIKFIEATNGFNWGKFVLMQFTGDEYAVRSRVDGTSIVAGRGWGSEHIQITDLATGEGAIFSVRRGALPKADLDKHAIWVCPLFEPFLTWLYTQAPITDLDALPALVTLPYADSALRGYRRPGPGGEIERRMNEVAIVGGVVSVKEAVRVATELVAEASDEEDACVPPPGFRERQWFNAEGKDFDFRVDREPSEEVVVNGGAEGRIGGPVFDLLGECLDVVTHAERLAEFDADDMRDLGRRVRNALKNTTWKCGVEHSSEHGRCRSCGEEVGK